MSTIPAAAAAIVDGPCTFIFKFTNDATGVKGTCPVWAPNLAAARRAIYHAYCVGFTIDPDPETSCQMFAGGIMVDDLDDEKGGAS